MEPARAPSSSPSLARWPGWSDKLWAAVMARLPEMGHVIVSGDPAIEEGLAARSVLDTELRPAMVDGLPAYALLDAGGLLAAPDRVAHLDWCARQVRPGGRVTHVLPAAPGAVPGQRVHPTYHDITRWFGEHAELGWTVEAPCEWGVPARCWIVSYPAGALQPQPDDLARKRALTRPVPTVSVCMIVRDAANTLLTTLHSVQCIADEIRIVDTGSVDSTLAVIDQFASSSRTPVHVARIPWPHDFAAARNRSIEGALGDWILWIDADERLIGGERLRRLLQSDHYEAYAVKQHNHVFDRGATNVEIPFRLFRNGRGYQFFGAVHEHPERILNHAIEPWMLAPGADILHYGYLTEPTRVRKLLERNLALINLDFQRYPGRKLSDVLYLRDCINLSRFDLRAEGRIRPDHVRCLEDALERFERVHFPSRGRYYSLGREFYDQGLMLLGQGHKIAVHVGGEDAKPQVHWFRDPNDAMLLAAEAARAHLQKTMGGKR